ncbi:MAG: ferritin [Gemmatimonadaceae bacterium]
MLSKPIQSALNDQINHELASAYLYLSMAAYFEATNLRGFAAWMRRQAGEETAHAMKIFDYVNDRDSRVTLMAIGQPPGEFTSPLDVFEQTLTHERKVTGLINRLCDLAADENDHATWAMLQWFVTEQVEEEKTAKLIVEQLRMIGATSSAIFFLDRHVGKDAEKKA